MVQFNAEIHEESIDQRIKEVDVEENALRMVAQRHERGHQEKGENHRVSVSESKRRLNEREENVVNELKKQAGSGEYKVASVNRATGMYGRAGEAGTGEYKQHGQWTASCSCGNWSANPGQALGQVIGTPGIETGIKYDAKPLGTSYQGKSLENLATAGYSSSENGGNYQ